jgi:hypothetical protein
MEFLRTNERFDRSNAVLSFAKIALGVKDLGKKTKKSLRQKFIVA